MTNHHHHFKLVVLLYACAALLSCASGWYFVNKGRVDVAIVFNQCDEGTLYGLSNHILKPNEKIDYDGSTRLFGGFKCFLYVLGPSSRTPGWSSLLTTITIYGTNNAVYLNHCQQPCRIRMEPDLNFVIL